MNNRQDKTYPAVTIANAYRKIKAFRQGYDDYMKGVPFDYDNTCLRYERGRFFAIYTKQLHKPKPKATWRKGLLSKAATERLVEAFRYGYML